MINATELKIGNIIGHCNPNGIFELKVEEILRKGVTVKDKMQIGEWFLRYEEIYHIPLTEEWLFKFCAKELKAKRGVLKEYVLKTVRLELSNSHNFYYKNSKVIITSVHQLMNLYFALTGEELCLKP